MPDAASGNPQFANTDVTVQWEVADDEGFKVNRRSGQVVALAALAHSVHLELDALLNDRWYFHRFQVGGVQSTVGRTRTLPHPKPWCKNCAWRMPRVSAGNMATSVPTTTWPKNLDMVLFWVQLHLRIRRRCQCRELPTGGWVSGLSDYRDRYALHKSEKGLQAMHAQCPWLVTWDDHEVSNDYAGLDRGQSGNIGFNFAAQRAPGLPGVLRTHAAQSQYAHKVTGRFSAGCRNAHLRSGALRQIGQHLFARRSTIQSRQLATSLTAMAQALSIQTSAKIELNPKRSLLGAEQTKWLDQAFSNAQKDARPWNVVAQQTIFGRRDFRIGSGYSLWNDGWDGYSAARQHMTQSMQNHALKNPVLIGGDVHETGWAMSWPMPTTNSAKIGVEFCGAGITARSAGNSKLAARLAENPHFIFADSERKGYGVVEFTAKQIQTELRVVDDVRQPQTEIETLAKFAVEAGVTQVQKLA
jgi:alkaline phosphatase D